MLGIVILNYNSYKLTIECVESILKSKIETKIVIVDNNSTDKSYEILNNKIKYYEDVEILLSKENGGYSKGNNYGIKFLENKVNYILILNPDVTIFDKKSVDKCMEVLKKDQNIGCVSPIGLINNQLIIENISWKLPKIKEEILAISSLYNKFYSPLTYDKFLIKRLGDILYSEVDVLPGSFLMFETKILQEINNFDENVFLYCEEKIISQKLKKINKRKALILNEFYYHNHSHKKQDLKNKKFHLKCLFDSKVYYLKNYCNLNNNLYIQILKILYRFNIYLYNIFDYFNKQK